MRGSSGGRRLLPRSMTRLRLRRSPPLPMRTSRRATSWKPLGAVGSRPRGVAAPAGDPGCVDGLADVVVACSAAIAPSAARSSSETGTVDEPVPPLATLRERRNARIRIMARLWGAVEVGELLAIASPHSAVELSDRQRTCQQRRWSAAQLTRWAWGMAAPPAPSRGAAAGAGSGRARAL